MTYRYSSRSMAYDTSDSMPDRGLSIPVQPSEDTGVKERHWSPMKTSNDDTSAVFQQLDSGIDSMHLNSSASRQNSTQSVSNNSVVTAYDPTDAENVYDMSHGRRGHFLIVNMHKFHPSLKLPDRRGTDTDAANLYTTFKRLGFDVHIQPGEPTCGQMMKLVVEYAAMDHSDKDCFAMALLTHGDTDGVIYGSDNSISIKKLVEPLKSCKTLAGKPKMFIIQACRGLEFDEGVDVTDAEVFTEVPPRPSYRLPREADFLYAYSTAPGYYAFRNSVKGSPFVSAIARTFEAHGSDLEILRLLTRVNRSVAYDYESKAIDPAIARKKQIPSFESMLTKELYFPKKKKVPTATLR